MERAGRARHRRAGRRLSKREQTNQPPLPFPGYFLYAGTSGSSGLEQTFLVLPRSKDESARASPARKISNIFKKVLTQFRFSRQKGVPQMMCAFVQRREKTN